MIATDFFSKPVPVDTRWLTDQQLERLGGDVFALHFSQAEKRILKKKKKIRPSVWAERHRHLPGDAAVPGRWRNSTVPYAAGILDASFFPSVQEAVVCAAPQTCKTEINYTCIGYAVDRKPGNALIVMPDENTARENSADRIRPMFEDSPRLRSYLTGYADDMASHKIRLQNAIIYMAWANSAARLANKPLPYVVLDEEDKYPETASKKEASPTDLAKKRTRTFAHMRKIWRTSSPSIETGPIWKALTEECQIVFDYWVRCPRCDGIQKMVFESIKWPEDLRDPLRMKTEQSAWYECVHCSSKWNDADRDMAVRAGEWRDRKNGELLDTALTSILPVTIGFHIPSWLSPFVKLWEVAHAFLEGLLNRNKMKDFRNGHAAEPWYTVSAERSEDNILALADDRPRGAVPGGGVVACLLAGVDTQDDGFYYEIRAFGYGLERPSWCIREGKVPTFKALAQVLWADQYLDIDSNVYPVRLTLQDAMGHRTSEVYDFSRMYRGRIFPTMGKQTMASPYAFSNIQYYPGTKKPIPGGLSLVRFDTNYFKNQLAGILEIAPGDPGCWHYHKDVTRDWARQMTVEGLNEKGVWENPQEKPNHAWDCSALLLLAHEVLGVAFWKVPEKEAPSPILKTISGPKDRTGSYRINYERPSWLR
ncbi:terminase gpA endonuclease subunit [uncultured Desulfosarcina sp.]|uniref:terminase gpA endonuclease subunit n=1 Tax=uncultured Desulfosarcina sp. TaxID=218289 RepID=UPI0029C932B7|nr:terminase gpA endonuclease subunit [uncultured Desulfosarcina sp.]